MLASNKRSLEEKMHFSTHQRPALNFFLSKNGQFIEVESPGQTVSPMPWVDGTNDGKYSASRLFQTTAVLEFKGIRAKIFQH